VWRPSRHRRGVHEHQRHQRQDQEDDAVLRVHSTTLLQVEIGGDPEAAFRSLADELGAVAAELEQRHGLPDPGTDAGMDEGPT
jgi:hypothetical protein